MHKNEPFINSDMYNHRWKHHCGQSEVSSVEGHPDKNWKNAGKGMILSSWSQSAFKTSQSDHRGDTFLWYLLPQPLHI